jgi:hypothetical protein
LTDKPIIFSAPMVRALLEGRKTQTRRIIKPQPELNDAGLWVWPPYGTKVSKRTWRGFCQTDSDGLKSFFDAPNKAQEALPAKVGDRLWVREACRAEELSRPQTSRQATKKERERFGRTTMIVSDELDGADGVRYVADDEWRLIENTEQASFAWVDLYYYRGMGRDGVGNVVSPIHMPRWASRMTLTVTEVRVQRLFEISDEDAIAEGWPGPTAEIHFPRAWFQELWWSIHGFRSWEANPWVAAISFVVERRNIDQP